MLAVATLLVFTQQESLYFVDGFTANPFSKVPVSGEISQSGNITTVVSHVPLVVESFSVLPHVLVTAVSASLLAPAVITFLSHNAVLLSIHVSVVVLAISPVALSILISSPHEEARVVFQESELYTTDCFRLQSLSEEAL